MGPRGGTYDLGGEATHPSSFNRLDDPKALPLGDASFSRFPASNFGKFSGVCSLAKEAAPAAKDIKDEIVNWLEKEGYPVEMAVARAFRLLGFRVRQAYSFVDPNTSKSRELDIVASQQVTIGGYPIRVVFVIECKWSRDKPWILFSDPSIKLGEIEQIRHRFASPFGRTLLEYYIRDYMVNVGFFCVPAGSAYAITTTFGDKDRAYSAISSVTSATQSLANVLERTPVAAILFPIVIFDGRLFDCYLAQDAKIAIIERDAGVLVWHRPGAATPYTIVHIATISNLDEVIIQAERTARSLLDVSAEHVREALGGPGGQFQDDPRTDF